MEGIGPGPGTVKTVIFKGFRRVKLWLYVLHLISTWLQPGGTSGINTVTASAVLARGRKPLKRLGATVAAIHPAEAGC